MIHLAKREHAVRLYLH